MSWSSPKKQPDEKEDTGVITTKMKVLEDAEWIDGKQNGYSNPVFV
jgi:hypothetical protein